MKRFVEGEDRSQITLLPECLDDYIATGNPVRAVEAFIDELDLGTMGFAGTVAEVPATRGPGFSGTRLSPCSPRRSALRALRIPDFSAPPTPAASAPLRRSGGNSGCQRHAYGIARA